MSLKFQKDPCSCFHAGFEEFHHHPAFRAALVYRWGVLRPMTSSTGQGLKGSRAKDMQKILPHKNGPQDFLPKKSSWKCVMLHHPVSFKSNRPRRGTEEWPDGRGALNKKHMGTHVVRHFGAPRKEGVRWCILMQRKNCFLGGKGHLWFLLCWESTIFLDAIDYNITLMNVKE